jgi:actin-like ATPase involved in cell morphogenesis
VIIDAVKTTLDKCPPELAGDRRRDGRQQAR